MSLASTLEGLQEVVNEEQALMRRLAHRDRQAMSELYGRFSRPIFAYLMRLMGDPAVAEELLQETMLIAWQKAGTFRGDSRPSTWLFGIARNLARNTQRRSHLPTVGLEDETLLVGSEGVASPAGRRLDLAQALEGLSPEHREVVQLVLVHGFTYDEAARIVGCPVGTIKSRLFYARRQLRGWLQACTEVPPEPCPE
jgi:RNA polymerase sigma-70 factor (ECF subfamily)